MKARRDVRVSVVPTRTSPGRYHWWAGNSPEKELIDDALTYLHQVVIRKMNS